MEIFGKSPIPVAILLLGKMAMLLCWIFVFLKKFFSITLWYEHKTAAAAGWVLYVVGTLIAVVALIQLGASARVGLPGEKTEFKTRGLYRLCRNPIYIGAFLMCAGSCLIVIHPVNLVLLILTVAIHHRIVKKEEQFLEKTFGQSWLDYKNRVPRYFGWPG